MDSFLARGAVVVAPVVETAAPLGWSPAAAIGSVSECFDDVAVTADWADGSDTGAVLANVTVGAAAAAAIAAPALPPKEPLPRFGGLVPLFGRLPPAAAAAGGGKKQVRKR